MGRFYKRRKDATACFPRKTNSTASKTRATVSSLKFRVIQLLTTGKVIQASPYGSLKQAVQDLKVSKEMQYLWDDATQDYQSYTIVDAWVCKIGDGNCPHLPILNGLSCSQAIKRDNTEAFEIKNCALNGCKKVFQVPFGNRGKIFCSSICSHRHHRREYEGRKKNKTPLKFVNRHCANIKCNKLFKPIKIKQTTCCKKCLNDVKYLTSRGKKSKLIARSICDIMISKYNRTGKPVLSKEVLRELDPALELKSIRAHLALYMNKLWKRVEVGKYIPLEISNDCV